MGYFKTKVNYDILYYLPGDIETLDSNILVISKKGKVLGVGSCPGVEEITELIDDEVGGFIDKLLNERLLGVLSTKENVNLQTLCISPLCQAVSDTVHTLF